MKNRKECIQNKIKSVSKLWWNEFENKVRLKRKIFNVILKKWFPHIELTSTNLTNQWDKPANQT